MPDLPPPLTDSPVKFETAVAYALQPVMRRLILIYIVGGLLTPVGVELFVNAAGLHAFIPEIGVRLIGLGITILGATLLFGGLIGAAFKLVTDANRLAVAE